MENCKHVHIEIIRDEKVRVFYQRNEEEKKIRSIILNFRDYHSLSLGFFRLFS